jgi:uncharacterized membrane protein
VWENGKMRDLGSLPGESGSQATDTNNAGGIVGTVEGKSGGLSRAVLWKAGQIYDLNDLTAISVMGKKQPILVTANAINDAGQIVGQTADHRGFLLTPVPTKRLTRRDRQ